MMFISLTSSLLRNRAVGARLLPSVAEHLNAEIVLMTVTDVSLAIDWLKCSFLYIRLRKVCANISPVEMRFWFW